MMQSDKKCNGSTERSDGWLITFGDLLTLLLCFFLSIISSNGEKISRLVNSQGSERPGIQIATLDGKKSKIWISFTEDELEGEHLMASLKVELEKIKTAKNGELSAIYVESCDSEKSLPTEWSWHQSVKLVLAVKGQIFDAFPQLEDGQVALRAVGKHCEAMNGSEKDSAVVIGVESLRNI